MSQIRMMRCVLALIGLAVPSLAIADGLIRDGVGAISIGRGGTNIAHFDNGAVLLDNPAGILNMPGNVLLEAGIDVLITDQRYSDPENSNVGDEPNGRPLPHGAALFKSDDGRWAAGIGIFMPAGFGTDWDLVNPIFGKQQYRAMGVVTKITPGLAYRVTDDLSIGATLGVGLNHLELEGPFTGQTGVLAGVPTLFDLKTDGAALVWSLGAQYHVSENTMIGVSYTSESDFSMDGQLDARIAGLAPVPVFSRFDAEVDQTYPQSVGAGITHLFAERHRVSADVIWYDWSSAFNSINFKFTNPDNPLLAAALPPTITDSVQQNWDDNVSVRLGYEYFAKSGDIWRLGYVYHDSPVPDNTLTPYTDGILQHAVSVGYSTCIKSWQLNTGYQYSFGDEQNIGQSALVGGDFNNGSLDVNAHWLAVSLLKTF